MDSTYEHAGEWTDKRQFLKGFTGQRQRHLFRVEDILAYGLMHVTLVGLRRVGLLKKVYIEISWAWRRPQKTTLGPNCRTLSQNIAKSTFQTQIIVPDVNYSVWLRQEARISPSCRFNQA